MFSIYFSILLHSALCLGGWLVWIMSFALWLPIGFGQLDKIWGQEREVRVFILLASFLHDCRGQTVPFLQKAVAAIRGPSLQAYTLSGPFGSRGGSDALLFLPCGAPPFVSLNLSHTFVSSYFMKCSLIIPFECFFCFLPMSWLVCPTLDTMTPSFKSLLC